MRIDLQGKHALVGGASRGIGRAIAESLAECGASVTLMARNGELLAEVCDGLARYGEQAHDYIAVDFDQPEELRRAVSARFGVGGTVHVLINNTGGPPGGPAFAADIAEFETAFKRHLICNQILAQVCIPTMRAARYGRIINIISTSVKQPIPGLGVSNTIRGAVANWAKTLASELGPDGITVNNILPGATATDRLESIMNKKADKLGMSYEDVSAATRREIPAQRFAEAWEIAAAAAFLASPLASYINGINVPVDGGRTASL